MEQQNAPPAGKNLKEKTLPELMIDLYSDITDLVNAQIAMAKAEMSEKASLAGQGAGLISAAIFSLIMTVGCATALAIIGLSNLVAPWLASLIVTGVWLLLAVILAMAGRGRFKKVSTPVPEKTMDTLKEGAQWVAKPTK